MFIHVKLKYFLFKSIQVPPYSSSLCFRTIDTYRIGNTKTKGNGM